MKDTRVEKMDTGKSRFIEKMGCLLKEENIVLGRDDRCIRVMGKVKTGRDIVCNKWIKGDALYSRKVVIDLFGETKLEDIEGDGEVILRSQNITGTMQEGYLKGCLKKLIEGNNEENKHTLLAIKNVNNYTKERLTGIVQELIYKDEVAKVIITEQVGKEMNNVKSMGIPVMHIITGKLDDIDSILSEIDVKDVERDKLSKMDRVEDEKYVVIVRPDGVIVEVKRLKEFIG